MSSRSTLNPDLIKDDRIEVDIAGGGQAVLSNEKRDRWCNVYRPYVIYQMGLVSSSSNCYCVNSRRYFGILLSFFIIIICLSEIFLALIWDYYFSLSLLIGLLPWVVYVCYDVWYLGRKRALNYIESGRINKPKTRDLHIGHPLLEKWEERNIAILPQAWINRPYHSFPSYMFPGCH
jgi:hypothetical protein